MKICDQVRLTQDLENELIWWKSFALAEDAGRVFTAGMEGEVYERMLDVPELGPAYLVRFTRPEGGYAMVEVEPSQCVVIGGEESA